MCDHQSFCCTISKLQRAMVLPRSGRQQRRKIPLKRLPGVCAYILALFAAARFCQHPAPPFEHTTGNDEQVKSQRQGLFRWLFSRQRRYDPEELSLENTTMIRVMNLPAPDSPHFATRQEQEIAYGRAILSQRLSKRSRSNKTTQTAPQYDRNQFSHIKLADEAYQHHGKPIKNAQAIFTAHTVGHTGVIVDATTFFYPVERLKVIIEWISKLGFNTLHLRLVGDTSFAVQLRGHSNLVFPSKEGGRVYTWSQLQDLSDHAYAYGVQIFPEINVISRAGGWHGGGLLSPCPQTICSKGRGIPLDLNNTRMLAVVSNVLDEFRQLFNSPFLHLGHDERDESRPCLEEAGIHVDFDSTERKLLALLKVMEIPSQLVIRWESSEKNAGSFIRKRAGAVTHYHLTNPPANETKPFLVTTNLHFDNVHQLKEQDGWSIFKKTRSFAQHDHVLGILAGTMELGPQTWSALNVDGKLIAMAIGLSNQAKNIYQREDFERIYKNVCHQMDFSQAMCKLMGKPRLSAEYWEQERNQQRELRKNATCERLTEWKPLVL